MNKKTSIYYNYFSNIYDLFSPKRYYSKPREIAIKNLNLKKGYIVLSVACGTGQNFEIFQNYLENTGLIISLDFSEGMLKRAQQRIKNKNWTNIRLIQGDANLISADWLKEQLNLEELIINSTICELGLTTIPSWKNVTDKMIDVTNTKGRITIMDWYMEKLTLTGRFVNWIGKGDITRPVWQYFKPKIDNFVLDDSFNKGRVFVASGTKKE